VWVHNAIFASGWSWEAVQTGGVIALAGFWERFFTLAFHIAVSALAGYGLAMTCPPKRSPGKMLDLGLIRKGAFLWVEERIVLSRSLTN